MQRAQCLICSRPHDQPAFAGESTSPRTLFTGHYCSWGLKNSPRPDHTPDFWLLSVREWCGLSVAGPFVCRCLNSLTMLGFHIPLVELDVRISRSRLSALGEKSHDVAHRRLRLRL